MIISGIAGAVFTVTFNVCGPEEPQLLLADTVISPPEILATVTMAFVVDVPVQPVGKVHVYEVAPATSDIL